MSGERPVETIGQCASRLKVSKFDMLRALRRRFDQGRTTKVEIEMMLTTLESTYRDEELDPEYNAFGMSNSEAAKFIGDVCDIRRNMGWK